MTRSAERLAIQSRASSRICGGGRLDGCSRFIVREQRCALRDEERRNIAGIVVAQLEVRHRCRGGVGLRILDPCKHPLAARFIGNVNQRGRIVSSGQSRAVCLLHDVAVHTAFGGEQLASGVQLWGTGQRIQVTLAAAGFNVLCG